jgi:sRNA-binding protein
MTMRERRRREGMNEGAKAIALLQEKWPRAFPKKFSDIKPLASSVKAAVIAEMGWDKDYAHGVLMTWKLRLSYCDAVLRSDTRIDIDGNATAEIVDEKSKAEAKEQREITLKAMRRRAAKRKERETENKKAAEATA